MSLAERLVRAAETVEELNARTDSGDRAAWTASDLQHVAGSFAAEEHLEGSCPVCLKTVCANDMGNIALHTDTFGRTCVACGEPFHIAVVTR